MRSFCEKRAELQAVAHASRQRQATHAHNHQQCLGNACRYAAACGVPPGSAPEFAYPNTQPPAAAADPSMRITLTSRTAAITSMRQSILKWAAARPAGKGPSMPPLQHGEELAAAVARHRDFYYQVSLPHYRDPAFIDAAVGRCGRRWGHPSSTARPARSMTSAQHALAVIITSLQRPSPKQEVLQQQALQKSPLPAQHGMGAVLMWRIARLQV